jgi:intergrase/recombinase
VKDKVRAARKYAYCLFNGDFSELQFMSESKLNLVMCSLSSLAKYLGIYEQFQGLVKAYGLKWKNVKAEDLLLSRIANMENNGNVLEWIRLVKAKIPKLNVFMDFMLQSGLRFEEAVHSYNLIIDLAREGRLNEYYNEEAEALEHYRFKSLFIRRTKKAFVSFIPKRLVETVSREEKLTIYKVWNWVKRNSLKCRFPDIREYYATVMTKWLNQSEIDFLQGRISGSVFMRNYFNPALITDLHERVFKGLAEIQSKL